MTPGGGAARLLRALGERAGAEPDLLDWSERPWASVTFSGTRHRLTLRLPDAATAERLLDGLDYAEFDLGNSLLVDIDCVSRLGTAAGETLTIDALTVQAD